MSSKKSTASLRLLTAPARHPLLIQRERGRCGAGLGVMNLQTCRRLEPNFPPGNSSRAPFPPNMVQKFAMNKVPALLPHSTQQRQREGVSVQW